MSTVSTIKSRRSSVTSQQSIHSKGQSKAGLAAPSKGGLSATSKGGLSVTSRSGLNGGPRASPMPPNMKKGGMTSLPEEGPVSNRPKSTETIKFVYSMAVAKALKRNYHVTQFGPPSAAPIRPDASVEISQLPQLYSDFQLITQLLENNQRYMEKMRLEMEAAREAMGTPVSHRGGSKFPHLSLNKYSKNSRGRGSRVAMVNSPLSTVPKFPPIS